jgi:hypothetical protein
MIESSVFYNSQKFTPYENGHYNGRSGETTYESEFIDLIRDIERAAGAKGLTLSRWQSNGSGRTVTVRYALHTGERAAQLRYMDDNAVIGDIELNALEGKTRRCAAYKELASMAESAGLWR